MKLYFLHLSPEMKRTSLLQQQLLVIKYINLLNNVKYVY